MEGGFRIQGLRESTSCAPLPRGPAAKQTVSQESAGERGADKGRGEGHSQDKDEGHHRMTAVNRPTGSGSRSATPSVETHLMSVTRQSGGQHRGNRGSLLNLSDARFFICKIEKIIASL